MATSNPIEIQKYLKGIDYPVTKEDLITHAEEQGADDDLLDILEQLPDDQFEGPTEVSKALSEA